MRVTLVMLNGVGPRTLTHMGGCHRYATVRLKCEGDGRRIAFGWKVLRLGWQDGSLEATASGSYSSYLSRVLRAFLPSSSTSMIATISHFARHDSFQNLSSYSG